MVIKIQQTLTVWEGEMSEISFYVNNIKKDKNITLDIFKNGQDKDEFSSCSLVLGQTFCVSHHLSCKCSTNLIEGQVEYVFRKKFRAQDSGEWVFDVCSTKVNTSMTVNVQGW